MYADVNLVSEAPVLILIKGETEQGVTKGSFKIEAAGAGLSPPRIDQLQPHLQRTAEFSRSWRDQSACRDSEFPYAGHGSTDLL